MTKTVEEVRKQQGQQQQQQQELLKEMATTMTSIQQQLGELQLQQQQHMDTSMEDAFSPARDGEMSALRSGLTATQESLR